MAVAKHNPSVCQESSRKSGTGKKPENVIPGNDPLSERRSLSEARVPAVPAPHHDGMAHSKYRRILDHEQSMYPALGPYWG